MKRTLFALSALTLLLAAGAARADVCPPAKVTNLTIGGMGHTTTVLSWNDPGDDCSTGTAASYEVRYANSAITESNYYSATVLATGFPGVAGTGECIAPVLPTCNHTYYFAITFTDTAGNRSPVSNSPNGTTLGCSDFREVDCP